MKQLVLLLSIAPTVLLLSQSYIPTVVEGNLWDIRRHVGLGVYLEWNYELRCDTLINTMTYSVIRELRSDTILGFVREDIEAQEVYFLDIGSNQEQLIVSYNLMVGDSLLVDTLYWIVDSVVIQNWYGAERKVIYFDPLTKFIEGVGHSWFGVLNRGFGGFGGPFQFIFDVYDTETVCEQISSNMDVTKIPETLVYPNPFSDYIQIIIEDERQENIILYSAVGELIDHLDISTSYKICTGSLPGGLYYLRMGNGRIHKLVKY